MDASLNVYGKPLVPCSAQPLTGFFRDGCCNTDSEDFGQHTVCCQVTEQFLAFSRSRGNDLTTPLAQYGFPGLKPGDRWCLCAGRWKEAWQTGCAPQVVLEATHWRALEVVSLGVLEEHAIVEEDSTQ